MPNRAWSLPPLRKSSRVASDELKAVREMAAAPRGEPPAGVTVTTTSVGGVDAVVCEPSALPSRGTVLYFHGGGYRLGAPAGWTAFTGAIAQRSGARVVALDYRLAPEHPFPAAVHDAVAAYDALLDDAAAGPLVVGGDSAGGGLAFALVLACRDAGVEAPAGVFGLSPWADMTITAGTFASRAGTDQFFPEASAHEAVDTYLQGFDPRAPLASPALGDLAVFPPALLLAGGDETLLDDTLLLAAGLARGGASVEVHAVAGMQHVWPMLFPDLAESTAALDAMGGFVRRQVEGGVSARMP
jgi:acetyl esterase/lipase